MYTHVLQQYIIIIHVHLGNTRHKVRTWLQGIGLNTSSSVPAEIYILWHGILTCTCTCTCIYLKQNIHSQSGYLDKAQSFLHSTPSPPLIIPIFTRVCFKLYNYTCTCLGCAVLLCLVVCLTLLASFLLPSHLSLKHVSTQYCRIMYNCTC